MAMNTEKIDEMLSKVIPALKKESLNKLTATLLKELTVAEKKEVLRAILADRKDPVQLIDMVDR